jgi:hypothetical protein
MTLRRGTISAVIAAGLLAAAAATGCGSSAGGPPGSRTGAQVLPAMQSAMDSATSVQLDGSAVEQSQKVSFDLSFVGNSDMSGSFSVGGVSLTIEVVSGKTYVKVDQGFLKIANLPASDCAAICGKYVLVPAAEARQLTGTINLAHLRKDVFSKAPSADGPDASDQFVPATFHGQQVLTTNSGGVTIDIARSGPPYPLLVWQSDSEHFTFSDWNSVPPLTPPPASEVITV